MVLVTIALLPLGLIAISQTHQIIRDQEETAERALLAQTEEAAARERRIMERAIGTATAMGNTAHSLQEDPALCRSTLSRFENGSALYSFLGFTPAAGSMGCYSGPSTTPSENGMLETLAKEQKLGLFINRNATPPGASVLVVATPAFENGDYVGHMQLHIPHANFETAEELNGDRPLGLITFNRNGEILTSERVLSNARGLLPKGVALSDLAREETYTFIAESVNGYTRVYALVPLVSENAYALGTWNTDTALLESDDPYWRTIILAVTMWVASLLVVFLIMQLLVIRAIQRLKAQVRLFRDQRTVPMDAVTAKGELFDLETDFRELTETIIREEAQLEDAVHEKNVLLKEVHHRVKNNLQLINSIINMILRGAYSEETRIVVRRLQDRVMALASVHRSIYQAQSMDRVDAAEIVREIVNQGVAIGLPRGSDVDVKLDLQSVSLYPDQAMPLSLLVSEAVTNALKYVGGPAPEISVRLLRSTGGVEQGMGKATLCVSNTTGDTVDDQSGTGLGSQLVRAFAHQLEGELLTTAESNRYALDVTFQIAQFDPEHDVYPQAAQ
ncbi:MAG: sensor histidine kinase [Roseobacter sp.]